MRKLLLVCLSSILISGCGKNFLDRKSTYYTDEATAYKDLTAIQSALTGCYDGLQDYRYYGRNFIIINEVMSGNAKLSTENTSNFAAYYNYSITAYESELQGLWQVGYQIINRSNNVIWALDNLSAKSTTDANQVRGEALALRALSYFDLVRTFAMPYGITSGVDSADGKGGHAGIPIVTGHVVSDSLQSPARSSVKKVYDLIISDLRSADTLITSVPTEPYTFSKYAVEALLARVYLTAGNWAKAFEYSSKLMNCGLFKLLTYEEYKDSWKKEYNNESILSIPFSLNDYNGSNSLGYMLSKDGYGGISASNDLYTLFSSTDIRKDFYKKGKDIFVYKYEGRLGTTGLDNTPVIRYSEMYFIKAEAMYELSLNSGSKDVLQERICMYLDTLRLCTSEDIVPLNVRNADLLSQLLEDKRKEFAFEGQYFFDIKRRLMTATREDCSAAVCSISPSSKFYTMPIPVSEINANKNITQNQGY